MTSLTVHGPHGSRASRFTVSELSHQRNGHAFCKLGLGQKLFSIPTRAQTKGFACRPKVDAGFEIPTRFQTKCCLCCRQMGSYFEAIPSFTERVIFQILTCTLLRADFLAKDTFKVHRLAVPCVIWGDVTRVESMGYANDNEGQRTKDKECQKLILTRQKRVC